MNDEITIDNPPKRLSDLPEDQRSVEVPLDVDTVIDREVTILAYQELPSSFSKGYYIVFDAELDGKKVQISTGATAIKSVMAKVVGELPLRVTFRRSGRKYYLE